MGGVNNAEDYIDLMGVGHTEDKGCQTNSLRKLVECLLN